MADIFTMLDVTKLLTNKHIVFLGDSNTRPLYKDIVCLLNRNSFISNADLRRKLEPSFMGDRLLKGDKLTRGRDYEEVRQFKNKNVHLEFFFITRCYNKVIDELIRRAKEKKGVPDVIVMNSVLWDITRWGPLGVEQYRDNLVRVMKLFKKHLPPDTLFVWNTAPPISQHCYGGTLIKQIDFLKHTLRFEVMEANMFARDVVGVHGFHVLDMHYYLRMHMLKRARDGIHWMPRAVRYMTNLLLTHIALSFEEPLPGNWTGPLLQEMVEHMALPAEDNREVALPAVPTFLQEDPAPVQNVVLSPFRSPFRQPPVAARKKKSRRASRWDKLQDKENTHACLVTPKLKLQQVQNTQHSWTSGANSAALQDVHNSVLNLTNTLASAMSEHYNCGSGAWPQEKTRHKPLSLQQLNAQTMQSDDVDNMVHTWRDMLSTRAPKSVVCVPSHSSRRKRRPVPY